MRARLAVVALALAAMAHVGSPDTFFAGTAGPYPIRVSVRLPGVIPGRAQVNVHVLEAARASDYRVTVRAGQYNVGLAGAPPPEIATPVPGDPTLYSTELWFMTPTSYEVFVDIDGPSGRGRAIVPTLALATVARTMDRRLGIVLAALGLFLSAGLLTIIGAAVRESVVPPGSHVDARRRRRARGAMAATALLVGAALWGGSRWWGAEAANYAESVLYRPFASSAAIERRNGALRLTLSIRDPRWTGRPVPGRYSALLPDHGKLMHLFAIRETSLDAFAHVHPVARTPEALDFDAFLPPLPRGRYRIYADIVHESGYAQTMVSQVDVPEGAAASVTPGDDDDSWYVGAAAPDGPSPAFTFADRSRIVWMRGETPPRAGEERVLQFAAQDGAGQPLAIEPYMGMTAHVAIASDDGSVFAHLHPAGSISMAALQHFVDANARAGGASAAEPVMPAHDMSMGADTRTMAIPYAFPKPGHYRMWVQTRRGGRVVTAAFDVDVKK